MNKKEKLEKALKLALELEAMRKELSLMLNQNSPERQLLKLVESMKLNLDESLEILKDF